MTSSSTSGASGVLVPPRREWKKVRGAPPRPPDDPGGGGGGGGGGEGSTPGGEGAEGAGAFALALALGGITTLFSVLVAVWIFLRRPAPDWRAAGTGALHALWVSTACLAASSVAVERGVRALRAFVSDAIGSERDAGAPRRWLGIGFALGLAFLSAQACLWVLAWRAGIVPSASGYAAVFFALTGLHALHVLGGLAILGILALRLAPSRTMGSAGGGPRGAASALGGVRLGAIYWHFMGLVWLVLFALLYFVR